MAALLNNRLSSPPAGSHAALFPTRRVGRRDLDWSGTLERTWSATCEGLFLLWMLAVVAFSLLVAAGAVGFLG